jgi:hypothetical protein
MRRKVLMGVAAIAIVAFLSGCGKAPQVQIDATNAAIENARTNEAAVYLPAEFAALQDSMNVITADIEVQKSKLFKNFGQAATKLEATEAYANKLSADAVVVKEEIKKEVETMLADIKTLIADNAKLIARAPRGKDGAAVIAQIKTDIATIDNTVVEAQGMYDKGAFMDSKNKIKAANESATGINTELKEAIAKVRR